MVLPACGGRLSWQPIAVPMTRNEIRTLIQMDPEPIVMKSVRFAPPVSWDVKQVSVLQRITRLSPISPWFQHVSLSPIVRFLRGGHSAEGRERRFRCDVALRHCSGRNRTRLESTRVVRGETVDEAGLRI